MNKKIKILHLEDLKSDAELVQLKLKETNMQFDNLLVDTREAFIRGLNQFTPDIILADHSVSAFNSMEALKIVKEKDLSIPFILVSAHISGEYSKKIIDAGANDCVAKDSLDLLPQSIFDALVKNTVAIEQQDFFSTAVNDTLKKTNYAAPDIAFSNESFYDLSMLEEMEDDDYLIEIISIFLNETPRELTEMRKAFTSGKADVVCKQAHKLKSSSGLIQATSLSVFLTQIEDMAKQGKMNDLLLKSIENAQEVYRKIEVKLKDHIRKMHK